MSKYKRSYQRLATFKDISNDEDLKTIVLQLANNGVYYQVENSTLICYFCKTTRPIATFKRPFNFIHKEICNYYQETFAASSASSNSNEERLNIESDFNPAIRESIQSLLQSTTASVEEPDTTTTTNTNTNTNTNTGSSSTTTNNNPSFLISANPPQSTLQSNTINDPDDMSNLDARLKTFRKAGSIWPIPMIISDTDLAKSGFFYLGLGDRVQCYACDGILRKWSIGDNAFTEHSKHFPDCSHISGMQDGQQYDMYN